MLNFNKSKKGYDNINNIIENYMSFIIKSISSVTGRYVSIENDEEFSVGLMAFVEAVERYDENKGNFSSYAKLVISSRVKSFLMKENKEHNNVSIDKLSGDGIEIQDICSNPVEDKEELIKEINKFKEELMEFGLSLEELADEAPRHEDTRRNAITLSEKVSKDEALTTFIFGKKRLPIKQISLKYTVTERIIKKSKKFILSVVIIFFKKYRNLMLWIKK